MAEIKFSNQKPPVYDLCVKAFDLEDNIWDRNVIFTYGDTIHSKNPIGEDLLVHESVHVRQQEALGPAEWWKKYLSNPDFRLEQELEAYREQFNFYKKTIKDRNKLFENLNRISFDLSYYYNLPISRQGAMYLIVNKK